MPPARDASGRFVTGGGTVTYTRIDPAKVAQLLRDPSGPMARKLLEDAELVRQEAKRRVGVYRPRPGGPRRSRRPGTLRDSIVKRMADENGGLVVYVGSSDPIALIHHEGTVPHRIEGNPWLVFWSDRVGRVVFARAVNHPGTRPNRYLVDALGVLRGRN
jgi:hypothetical protein